MNRILGILAVALLALGLAACNGEDDGGGGGGGGGAGGPEIAVSRGAVILSDGGADALGSTPFGTPQTLSYLIDNTGGSALNLTGSPIVQTASAVNCTANVTTQATTPLAVSGSSNFVISLTVTTAAAFSVQISIANDDTNENPFDFTISGTGATVPEIDVQRPAATSIADGGTDNVGGAFVVGPNPAITWTIANSGTATLNLSGGPNFVTVNSLSGCTVVVTQPATGTIAMAASTTFQLTITTSGSGPFSFQFHVSSDDSNESPYDVTVSGSVPTPTPEIDVQRPAGTSKPDNTTDAVGAILVGANPPIAWTIANIGTGALTLTGGTPVTTSNPVGCSVVVTQPAVSSVAAASSTTFSLTITTTLATWSFDLDIASNDADEANYDLIISGTASATGVLTVSTERASIAASSSSALGTFLQDTAVAIPVILRNTGGAALTVGTVTTSAATNCVATVRDQPATNLAANESSTMVLLLRTQTTGAISFTVDIPNGTSTFSFTLTATHLNPTRVLYIETGANAPNLRAALFPGTPTPVTISGAPVAGATGVGTYFHLGDRAVYTEQLAIGGPTHLYLVGIPPATPATPLAITNATHVGTSGTVSNVMFTSGDNVVFTATVNGGPAEVWTCAISGAVPSAPVKISGTVTAGGGAFQLFPSPRGDMVAFAGQFDTAGVTELYVASTNGTTLPRTKLNATLTAGRTIVNFNALRWLPDQRGVVYEEDANGSSPRHLFFARASASPAAIRISPVPTSGVGVRNTIGFTPLNHIQISRTSDRVFFLFNDLSGGRNDVFMATIPLTGSPSVGVTCTGSVTGVTNGVTGFRVNYNGDRVVSVIDTGAGSPAAPELYRTTVSGSTPTTTRIVQVTVAGRQGVLLDDTRALVSSNRFWFTNDDAAVNRQELFFTDVAGTVTVTRLPGSGAFTGGSVGVQLTGVLVHPDGGRIVFATNQNGGANYSMMVSTVSTTPAVTQLSTAAAGGPGLPIISGERLAYTKDGGGTPVNVFTNLLTGTTATEVQVSSTEISASGSMYSDGIVIFSTGRIFYRFMTQVPGLSEGLAHANTTTPVTRQVVVQNNNLASSPPFFKLGHEPR